MGMDVGINIFGISEKDENYEKMLAAFKACTAVGTRPPKEILDYFNIKGDNYEENLPEPSLDGQEIDLDDIDNSIVKVSGDIDYEEGVEYLIDITKIPKHIKKIKVHAFYW